MFNITNPAFLGWYHEEKLITLSNQMKEAIQSGNHPFVLNTINNLSVSELNFIIDRLRNAGIDISFIPN